MRAIVVPKPQLAKLLGVAARIGADPADSEEVRLQKALLVGIAGLVIIAAVLWGTIYAAFREFLAASIPLSYAAASSLSILVYAANRSFRWFRFSQLLLILLLPFLLMIVLGGFVNSSAVILWALLSPLGALIFSQPRQAVSWLVAFLGLIITSGLLQPYVRPSNNLHEGVRLLFFVMNIGTISAIAFVLVYYFIEKRNESMQLLRSEQIKSERLLLNILPKDIAEILKREDRVIADHYDAASILFADLVGFTPLSAKLAPVEMVQLLNDIYSHFDGLVDRYGLEKIRTIGDNYMVVSGVPRSRSDHAQALADMALDMCSFLDGYTTRSGDRIHFRIGMNSGPLVAGVVGKRKFQYDVWGDAVNLASRMESHGVPDEVHVGDATYHLLKDQYLFESRGLTEIKGKGQMKTWLLKGKLPTSQIAAGLDRSTG